MSYPWYIYVAFAFLFLLCIYLIRKNKKNSDVLYNKNTEIANLRKELISVKKEHETKMQELTSDFHERYNELKKRNDFLEPFCSNLTGIPYMAQIMADFETYGIEALAKKLDWGYDCKRANKVASIREIRKIAKEIVEKNKEAQYQLSYLLKLYPGLEDVIECDFQQLPVIELSELKECDHVRDYLSNDEYQALSETERNQLALDRYKSSHNKTKWQIGRDYEQFVGYTYEKSGYSVDYFGQEMKLEDLGRDLIATKGNKTIIVQCKYWSLEKQIHEKHILQLYGTVISFCIENKKEVSDVIGVLITNTNLSDTAKTIAEYLKIKYRENVSLGEYPMIKCNIGRDEFGFETKIYHLPFDQQYDTTKVFKSGECYAMTVEEAERKGFRRAKKWYSTE